MEGFFRKVVDIYRPDFAIAYGSGVFRQEGYGCKDCPMVDFVFGVESPKEWHRKNMKGRPKDYSLGCFMAGEGFVSFLQKRGAGIFYNPYVNFEGNLIKYGVISLEDLREDLVNWNNLYVAGRMHKPVRILKSNSEIDVAINKNLEMAVNVARLLLPEKFSESEFYEQIAGISYLGDSRIGIAENPQKVKNIVSRNLQEFREWYSEVLGNQRGLYFSGEMFEQNKCPTIEKSLYDSLPQIIWKGLERKRLGEVGVIKNQIRKRIAEIVSKSSKVQTLKGLISAGPIKSWRYVEEKIAKARKGTRAF